jgi:hypothetical protein
MKRLPLLALFAFAVARATAAEPTATIDTAIAKGDTAEVQRLLTAQPELIRTPGAGKMLPLHQAILRKKADIVALLLERGADVNAPDPSQRTPSTSPSSAATPPSSKPSSPAAPTPPPATAWAGPLSITPPPRIKSNSPASSSTGGQAQFPQ